MTLYVSKDSRASAKDNMATLAGTNDTIDSIFAR